MEKYIIELSEILYEGHGINRSIVGKRFHKLCATEAEASQIMAENKDRGWSIKYL